MENSNEQHSAEQAANDLKRLLSMMNSSANTAEETTSAPIVQVCAEEPSLSSNHDYQQSATQMSESVVKNTCSSFESASQMAVDDSCENYDSLEDGEERDNQEDDDDSAEEDEISNQEETDEHLSEMDTATSLIELKTTLNQENDAEIENLTLEKYEDLKMEMISTMVETQKNGTSPVTENDNCEMIANVEMIEKLIGKPVGKDKNSIVLQLSDCINHKRSELKLLQAIFMKDTQNLIEEQKLSSEIAKEQSLLLKSIEDYQEKIKDIEYRLKTVDSKKAASDAKVDDYCVGIERRNKTIHLLKSDIAALENERTVIVAIQLEDKAKTSVSSTVSKDGLNLTANALAKSDTEATLKGNLSGSAIKVENARKDQSNLDDSTVVNPIPNVRFIRQGPKVPGEQPTCYFFNIGSCPDGAKCPNAHECAHCGLTDHYYQKCNKKPHICSYFNRDQCTLNDCFRQHLCIMCHEEGHPIHECKYAEELPADAKQKNFDLFCLNWNASGSCRVVGCTREHICAHCSGSHPSLDCPHAVHKTITSDNSRIVLLKNPEITPVRSPVTVKKNTKGKSASNGKAIKAGNRDVRKDTKPAQKKAKPPLNSYHAKDHQSSDNSKKSTRQHYSTPPSTYSSANASPVDYHKSVSRHQTDLYRYADSSYRHLQSQSGSFYPPTYYPNPMDYHYPQGIPMPDYRSSMDPGMYQAAYANEMYKLVDPYGKVRHGDYDNGKYDESMSSEYRKRRHDEYRSDEYYSDKKRDTRDTRDSRDTRQTNSVSSSFGYLPRTPTYKAGDCGTICQNFNTIGTCLYGDQCRFKHICNLCGSKNHRSIDCKSTLQQNSFGRSVY